MDATICPRCGRALSEHDRHVRFTWPDAVLSLPERERVEGVWMTGENARDADLMQVPRVGTFVRALLPVRLTEGYQLTYGVWLQTDEATFFEAIRVWHAPEYVNLTVPGALANAIPPWGLLGAPVRAIVRDPGHTPYCDSSSDPTLQAVLHDEWPHETVLASVTT